MLSQSVWRRLLSSAIAVAGAFILALSIVAWPTLAGDGALISAEGTKYNDLNGNGIRDPGEPGLSGWTIYIDLNNNGQLDPGEPSAVTDSNGNFAIVANIDFGTYPVREVPQSGWTITTSPVLITVPPVTITGLLFGNRQSPTPTPPAEVPESDTLWLFGAGGLALSAYVLLRRRTARAGG